MDKEDGGGVIMYNGILLAMRKKAVLPFVTTWMDLEGIMLSKSGRERHTLCDTTCMWNVKRLDS